MNKINKSYIAGIFDGEGYAGVKHTGYKKLNRKWPVITIHMTDKEPISLLHKYFPAGKNKKHYRNIPNRKPYWIWSVSCRKALNFAKTILPYIHNKSKVKQLNKVISFYRYK